MNAYYSRFKTWMRPFNGISTAYLQNYAIWHLFHDLDRQVVEFGQEKLLFSALDSSLGTRKCPICGTPIPLT